MGLPLKALAQMWVAIWLYYNEAKDVSLAYNELNVDGDLT
jgi:hypothetical protein